MRWLADHYFAEGPGISKDAPKRTGLALVVETMWREGIELMKLNLLFVLACLPVVTVPAAFAALMRVTLTMAEDRNVYLVEDFAGAFRRHFLRATLLGLTSGVMIALPAYAAYTYAGLSVAAPIYTLPLALSVGVVILFSIAGAYAFALLVASEFALGEIARLSLLAALARPGKPLAALGFVAVFWVIHILFYPVTLVMPAIINFAFGTLAIAFGVHETVNRLVRAKEERAGMAEQAMSGA
ncbi:MAG TPA: YesL family protein [Ensifer sp.]|nr:YesL family protein [Ensifer sp.]